MFCTDSGIQIPPLLYYGDWFSTYCRQLDTWKGSGATLYLCLKLQLPKYRVVEFLTLNFVYFKGLYIEHIFEVWSLYVHMGETRMLFKQMWQMPGHWVWIRSFQFESFQYKKKIKLFWIWIKKSLSQKKKLNHFRFVLFWIGLIHVQIF